MTEPRRSILNDWGLPPAPQEHVQSIPVASTPGAGVPRRRGRKPTHKRSRAWEAAHKPQTFVGVPVEIREAICNLADAFRREQGLVGGVDAVARELLRYSLTEYAAGRLGMHPARSTGKTTLAGSQGWGTPPSRPLPTRRTKAKKPKPATATYRLPQEQVEKIHAIIEAEENRAAPAVIHLTLGLVVTRLLEHALAAYHSGALSLYTTPVMTIQGLEGQTAK